VVVDSLWSPALGTRKRFLVYLPPSYARAPARRYPVAYYLHGLWGDETNWTRQGRLDAAADSLARLGRPELVVVMPDGDDSWYTTWHTLGTADACRADTTRREPPRPTACRGPATTSTSPATSSPASTPPTARAPTAGTAAWRG
jgi:enterochelin esterase-like enzyme